MKKYFLPFRWGTFSPVCTALVSAGESLWSHAWPVLDLLLQLVAHTGYDISSYSPMMSTLKPLQEDPNGFSDCLYLVLSPKSLNEIILWPIVLTALFLHTVLLFLDPLRPMTYTLLWRVPKRTHRVSPIGLRALFYLLLLPKGKFLKEINVRVPLFECSQLLILLECISKNPTINRNYLNEDEEKDDEAISCENQFKLRIGS